VTALALELNCYFFFFTGRVTAHDVAAFARDASVIRLEALSPKDFDSQRVGPASSQVWFIDFFAPVSQLYINSYPAKLNRYAFL
jgi:hypothetical protein